MQRWTLIGLALALVAAAPPPASVLRSRLVLASGAEASLCLAFRPDGKVLASASGGFDRKTSRRWAEIKVWDLSTGKPRAAWQGHRSEPAALTFSPDGKTLVSVTSSLERIHWDVSAGKAERTFGANRSGYAVRSLIFSRDGKRIGVSGMYTAVVWDATSGKELFAHRWKVNIGAGVLSHDLRLVAVPNYQDVDLWDVNSGKLVRSLLDHRGTAGPLSFSRDDQLLAVSCNRGTDEDEYVSETWLWDVVRGRRQRVISLGNLFARAVALSGDGTLLATAGSLDVHGAAELRLFATATGAELARVQPFGVRWIQHLTFSPDGKMLAAICDRDVRLWVVQRPAAARLKRAPK